MTENVGGIQSEWRIDTSDLTRLTESITSLGKKFDKVANEGESKTRTWMRSMGDFGNVITGLKSGIDLLQSVGRGVENIGRAFVSLNKDGMEFDRVFSSAMANLDPDDVAKYEKELRKLNITLGKETSFSASQAAEGMTELAKAGLSAEEILGGALSSALTGAAAGELALGEAAELVAVTMNQFGLEATETQRIVDEMAGVASLTSTGMRELGMAFNQVGTVANTVGFSTTELSTALGIMAEKGLQGSDAGTSLKTMLLNLVPQSKEAKAIIQELGIEFFNADGSMKGFRDVVAELQGGFKGLTEEQSLAYQKLLFGQDAIRSSAILIDGGTMAWDRLNASIGNFSAETVAQQKLNNLAGDIEAMWGSVEAAKISIHDGLSPALRDLAQWATGVINRFTDWISITEHVEAVQRFAGDAVQWFIGKMESLIGWVVTTVQKIGQWWLESDDLKNKLIDTGTALGGIIAQVWEYVTALGQASVSTKSYTDRMLEMQKAFSEAHPVIGGIADQIGGLASVIGSLVSGDVRGSWEGFKDIISGSLTQSAGVMEWFTGIINNLFGNSVWPDAFKKLSIDADTYFGRFSASITENLDKANEGFEKFTKSFTTHLANPLKDGIFQTEIALKNFYSTLGEIQSVGERRWTQHRNALLESMTGISGDAKEFSKKMRQTLREILDDWLMSFMEKWLGAQDTWSGAALGILKRYQEGHLTIFDAIREVMAQAVENSWYTDALKKWTKVTGSWAGSTVKSLATVAGAYQGAMGAINGSVGSTTVSDTFSKRVVKTFDAAGNWIGTSSTDKLAQLTGWGRSVAGQFDFGGTGKSGFLANLEKIIGIFNSFGMTGQAAKLTQTFRSVMDNPDWLLQSGMNLTGSGEFGMINAALLKGLGLNTHGLMESSLMSEASGGGAIGTDLLSETKKQTAVLKSLPAAIAVALPTNRMPTDLQVLKGARS